MTLLSTELKFILDLIFDKFNEKKYDFRKLDYEKIIEISSANLLIPVLFHKINNSISNKVPKDFYNYCKYIFKENENRNNSLLYEIKYLSKILISNDINHVFLKGSANICHGIYENSAERMIGDIDFLIHKNDIEKTERILIENNYLNNTKKNFFNSRHLARRRKKTFIFSIEPHTMLFENKSFEIDPKIILKTKVKKKGIYIPDASWCIKYNVLAYLINDHGDMKLELNLKNYYDTFKYLKKFKNHEDEMFHLKISNYIFIARRFEIPVFENHKIKNNTLRIFRIKMKFNNKFFYKIDYFLARLVLSTGVFYLKLNSFLFNDEYRNYILNKLKIFFR